MAWFDGSFEWDEEKLEKFFPVVISQDLRTNADRTSIAIVNNFVQGSELEKLSDPHAETIEDTIFYHTFLDKIPEVKAEIKHFIDSQSYKEPGSIVLLRNDPERLFMYSNGHICLGLVDSQDDLRRLLPDQVKDGDTFILPLKRYMHKCPVCGHRTLQYRGWYDVCVECGWEDEGIDDDDDEAARCGPNGDYTIGEYRENYLKLKAQDPDYRWYEEFPDLEYIEIED